jgi:hypothetical protein
MPSLPNTVSAWSGATLDIKNLDLVDCAADNISCTTFTGLTCVITDADITNATIDNLTISSINVPNVECDTLLVNQTADITGDLTVDTDVLKVDTTNNRVGVNKALPTEALDVVGNIVSTGTITSTGDLTVDTDVLKVDTTNNRIGINKAAPTEALDVVGNIAATGTLTTTGDLTVDTNVLKVDTTNNYVGINKTTPVQALDVVGNIAATGSAVITGDFTVDTNALRVDTTNNYVGINKTTPVQALDVVGNIAATGSAVITGDLTVDTNTLRVDTTNNYVGINKTTPTQALDVVGNIAATGSAVITGDLTVDTNALRVDTTNNYVGINKTTPAVPLDVVGNTNINGNIAVSSANAAAASVTVGKMLVPNNTTSTYESVVNIGVAETAYQCGYLKHKYYAANSNCEFAMGLYGQTAGVICKQSRVGIAKVPASGYALDVNGAVFVSSDFIVSAGAETIHVDSTLGRLGVNVSAPAAALDVDGSMKLTGKIVSFTTMPTLTNQDIGYSAIYAPTANQTTLVSNTVYKLNNGNLFTLPVGVWRIDLVAAYTTSTAGTITITRVQLGFNTGSGAAAMPTYDISDPTGFRYAQEQVEWAVATGQTLSTIYSRPTSFTLRVDAAITNFYGCVATSHGVTAGGATLNLTTNSYVQITRLA